jgi:hypothetical protein
MFQEVALVDEVTVIKDKATKASRGADPCARIWFLPPPFFFAMPPGGDFGVFSRCSLAPKVFELCRGFLILLPPCFAAVFSAAMPPPPPPEEPESFRRRRIWTGLSFFYHARGRSRVEFYEYRGF